MFKTVFYVKTKILDYIIIVKGTSVIREKKYPR